MSQQEGDDGELRDKGEDATLIEQFMQSTEGENTESIRNIFKNPDAMAALESADSELKTAILAQPDVVDELAASGMGPNVVRIMDTLDSEQQAEVLKARYAIAGLLHHGESDAVFRLLGDMNADQKTDVLSQSGVVFDIAREKQGGKLIKLMRSLDWYRQATILEKPDAISALRSYGQRESVNKMLAGIRAAQEPWLSNPAVTH